MCVLVCVCVCVSLPVREERVKRVNAMIVHHDAQTAETWLQAIPYLSTQAKKKKKQRTRKKRERERDGIECACTGRLVVVDASSAEASRLILHSSFSR